MAITNITVNTKHTTVGHQEHSPYFLLSKNHGQNAIVPTSAVPAPIPSIILFKSSNSSDINTPFKQTQLGYRVTHPDEQ